MSVTDSRRLSLVSHVLAGLFVVACCTTSVTFAGDVRDAASRTEVKALNAFLLIHEQALVPARDQGVLESLGVTPGEFVERGAVLGRLDLVEATLTRDAAALELRTAKEELAKSLKTKIADAELAETQAMLEAARVEETIAKQVAEADVAVRLAENAKTLADEELKRGEQARAAFQSSISDMELMRLRLTRDERQLEVEDAEHEEAIEALRSQSRSVAVSQQSKAVERLTLEKTATENERALAKLRIERLAKAVATADERLRKRSVLSPLDGLVVEKLRQVGEWVEPGDAVVRVVRLDRLLVEGYVPAKLVNQSSVGSQVRVAVTFNDKVIATTGQLVFVSPEVDRVNLEVVVRAEIANDDLQLRPGQPAELTLLLEEP